MVISDVLKLEVYWLNIYNTFIFSLACWGLTPDLVFSVDAFPVDVFPVDIAGSRLAASSSTGVLMSRTKV